VGTDNYLDRKFIVLQWLNNKYALFIKETGNCYMFIILLTAKAKSLSPELTSLDI